MKGKEGDEGERLDEWEGRAAGVVKKGVRHRGKEKRLNAFEFAANDPFPNVYFGIASASHGLLYLVDYTRRIYLSKGRRENRATNQCSDGVNNTCVTWW